MSNNFPDSYLTIVNEYFKLIFDEGKILKTVKCELT